VLTAVVLAALMSAAMSTVSSVLNGFGAVGVEDYYRWWRPGSTDRERLAAGRLIVAVTGVLSIAGSLLLIPSRGTAMGLWWVVAPIVSAGIVGLFVLALFSPRANRQGIYAGIAVATGFTAWAAATLNDAHAFDLGFLRTPVHGYLIGLISGALFIVVGYATSLLFPDNRPEQKALTYWGWRARRRPEQS
jgi:SSS family solute:Na+ symporter